MFIRPNHSIEYRNWAYCCSEIHRCQFLLDYYSAGKTPDMYGHSILRQRGRTEFLKYCLKKARMLSRNIARYTQLRDKLAAGLDAPDSHLLQVEDMLDMVGNVIEITPRHSLEIWGLKVIEITPPPATAGKSSLRRWQAVQATELSSKHRMVKSLMLTNCSHSATENK